MFLLQHSQIQQWAQQGSTGIIPRSIDASCPHCKRHLINFRFDNWIYVSDYKTGVTSSRCPACQVYTRFLIFDVQKESSQTSKSSVFQDSDPVIEESIEEGIQEISPQFVAIFTQAAMAEAAGLDSICGVGYRKALEFLIKDYVKTLHPDKDSQIEKSMLAKCIQEFVDDPNVKIAAERAVWLGNDETHYVRKWVDKDLDDLKTLLKITRHWISSAWLTQKLLVDMPKP